MIKNKEVTVCKELYDSTGLPAFIVKGRCTKIPTEICNIGYACDGCPYNQDNSEDKKDYQHKVDESNARHESR